MNDKNKYIKLTSNKFNNIFIVENRNDWPICIDICDKKTDLVLCVDFALKNELTKYGYQVEFLDHLINASYLDSINEKTFDFLYNWYKDESGNDLLEFTGIDLGYSFLLFLTSDITLFTRFFFNINALKFLEYHKLYVSCNNIDILNIINKNSLKHDVLNSFNLNKKNTYYFPISKWMNEAIGKDGIKKRIKKIITKSLDYIFFIFDLCQKKSQKNIYIQVYHPTENITQNLLLVKKYKIILDDYVFNNKIPLLKQRRIPKFCNKITSIDSKKVFELYQKGYKYKWNFEEHNISNYLYEIVDGIVLKNIDEIIVTTKNIQNYFNRIKLDLMITVTDLWPQNKLLMNFCKNNNIPVYFIMNGLLNTSTSKEGKDSLYVNCYSISCKEDYFINSKNAFPIGDPRMDKYSLIKKKNINRKNPTIVIGAAGYDVLDLNSYLAYEFDFLYDILIAIINSKNDEFKPRIILKIRANGYYNTYVEFINEYFPELNIEIEHDIPFYRVIQNADLYISIFSQTIFEASSIGIPSIYYKKDTQTFYRPFNNECELVTAFDIKSLEEKLSFFINKPSVFNDFLNITTLEKYIGHLDGRNLNRNLVFINQLLEKV